jgi:tetratricopeptide (TPR) repeat protein
VGRRLREARERAGLSQRQLAFPGCTPAYISRIEAGKRIPSLQLLRELGRRVGASADYLATGVEAPTQEESHLLEAQVAIRMGELEPAEQLYTRALEDAVSADERGEALVGLGRLAWLRSQSGAAIEYLEEALELLGERGLREPALGDALGRGYSALGELESAIGIFERYLKAAKDRKDAPEQVRFSALLATALIETGNYDRARELLRAALDEVAEELDPIAPAKLYWSQLGRTDLETGARYARRALELLEAGEHIEYVANAHSLLAQTELKREQPEEALQLSRRAREFAGERATPLELLAFDTNEAQALTKLGRRDEAAVLATVAADRLAELENSDSVGNCGRLAEIFEELGQPDRARELYERAIELAERCPWRPWLAEFYARLAGLLEREGRRDEAYDVLKRALSAQTGPRARAGIQGE